ncbi:NACHT, LRR and PYD domains-containing protein 3 [Kryptolebias marmoratus]|uniref:NACHT, LRR and PYD domains-containing protein 3 n=1 Tax=Kryptolebias marmoratus TaxID=37003 RepID=UPI000D52FDFC|nr:NACHT, LRR and PYD domains-containing protein 3 [Kryptolebias marmoratus]
MSRKEKKKAVIPAQEELVLKALKDLEDKEFKEFKWFLQKSDVLGCLPVIPKSKIKNADRTDTVDQMLQTYCENTLEVTKMVLRKLERNDLVKILAGLNSEPVSESFAECQKNLKSNIFLKRTKFQEEIYTEVYLAVTESREVSMQHEIRQVEAASRKTTRPEKAIKYKDIFKDRPGRDEPVKKVLTTGVSGIGKTLLTEKFCLDWADDRANQDIHFLFPFTFRELNVLKEKKFSLIELIQHFFPETKDAEISNFEEYRLVFVFDGLDESRLPLDFRTNKIVTDVTETASVDVLLTNLIKGKLLPSARLWITTRPTAANQIPDGSVDVVTEILGFNDAQKLDYFKKKCKDDQLVNRIMSYIKTSPALNTMCHIPVCCWIMATVLEEVMKTREEEELPKTLTELYINFLQIQSIFNNRNGLELEWSAPSKEKILNLGKLAFEQLQKGILIFYESDLTKSGINLKSVSLYTGMFTDIFKEETGQNQDKAFRFTHLSVQEFLAALYVHLKFMNSDVNLLDESGYWMLSMRKTNLHHSAVDKALQSPNGHLDLFLRFLLCLSLPTNQKLLNGLLQKKNNSQTNQDTIKFIKDRLDSGLSTEKTINLFHCLKDLNDHSLVEETKQSMSSGRLSMESLSPAQWSALVFILLSSEEEMDMFDLKKYSASEQAFLRLLPVLETAKRALLGFCNLSKRSLEVMSSVLSAQYNILKELDLSNNELQDSGVKLLSSGLESPHCSLEILRLSGCELSWTSCETLASIISTQSSCLKELDVSNNELKDSGVESLSTGLRNSNCTLEILRLSGCQITVNGCKYLASALSANPNHMKELDLSYNHPGDEGIEILSNRVKHHQYQLETLKADDCGEQRLQNGLKKYVCELELDLNTAHRNLKVSDDRKTVTVVREEQPYPDHLERFEHCCWQVLCKNGLAGRSYWEVEMKGPVIIAVSYKRISRRGNTADCRLGWNDQCWSLVCTEKGCSFWHNKEEKTVSFYYSSLMPNRIGVYVDYSTGTVSFYNATSNPMLHLYTFHTKFTAPVYPAFGFGFGLWSYDSTVSLCDL